jgi:chanoclavine-I dehydrogenase
MMSAILKDKVFTITGGASGIGAATVKLLAQRSAGALCIVDRQVSSFRSLRQEFAKISPQTKER